jgi:hypothetical protein
LIGGAKFDPAKSAGSVIFDVWHDAESVLLGKRGGKRGSGRKLENRSQKLEN